MKKQNALELLRKYDTLSSGEESDEQIETPEITAANFPGKRKAREVAMAREELLSQVEPQKR